jgi:hypothetical protein
LSVEEETMANGSTIRWRFVRHVDNGTTAWTWQRFGPDGRVEKTSEPQATYGKALVAALQNGFRPDQDDYTLDLPYGRMHFPPGGPPEFCPGSLPLAESVSVKSSRRRQRTAMSRDLRASPPSPPQRHPPPENA